MMKKLPVLVMIFAVPLSGCAMQQGDFPSLQKRPHEDGAAIDETLEPAPEPTSLPADIQGRLDAAVAQSRAAHQRFIADLPAVKRRVDAARGAAVSSESWVVAQMELAALETRRSPSVAAMADIDALHRRQLENELANYETGGVAIITRQRELVQSHVEAQQTEIEAMKNRLR